MELVFIPSLEHMAMVKLTTRICEHPDILPFTNNCSTRTEDNLKQFFENANEIIRLPNSLQSIGFLILKAVCFEIFFWRKRHQKALCFTTVETFMKFSWRSDGTIHSSKTAKALVTDENVPFCCRFYFACCHFLENDILYLWNRFPIYDGTELFHSPSSIYTIFSLFLPWIESGFSAEFLANEFKPTYFSDEIFLDHLYHEEVSLRCFIERLPIDKCIDWLKKITKRQYLDRDLAHFVVCGSLRNQEIAVFRENATIALLIFLRWPLQSMFVDVAKHLWNYLSEEKFLLLLNYICDEINVRDDFDYSELFQEFWRDSPLSYKEYVEDKLENTDDEFLNLKSILRR
ncbi:unnamed protein product [Larinioides sclopetarius]|uniref:Uncharacterized protein n=1 Tax=Larinioides sclopetarius TaxID=280406 RepID=A0AAV1ZN61_9ARAC